MAIQVRGCNGIRKSAPAVGTLAFSATNYRITRFALCPGAVRAVNKYAKPLSTSARLH